MLAGLKHISCGRNVLLNSWLFSPLLLTLTQITLLFACFSPVYFRTTTDLFTVTCLYLAALYSVYVHSLLTFYKIRTFHFLSLMLYRVLLLIWVILCSLEGKLNIDTVAFKCASITVSCVTQSDVCLSLEQNWNLSSFFIYI